MPNKQIPITDRIRQMIAKANGGDIDTNTLAVFESISLNTLPLNKPGTVWHKARMGADIMHAMASHLQKGESVPLIKMHNGSELPIGKVFHGEAKPRGAQTELRTLFYLPVSETDLVTKIEAGVIDEVSVGIKPKHLTCSECGWDYFGGDAGIMNFLELQCANGHALGKGGVHAVGIGLEKWSELSLVGKGAADHPKIVAPAGAELNADAFSPKSVMLYASAGTEDSEMDLAQLVAQLSEKEGVLALLKRDHDTATASVTALTAQVATLTTELEECKKNLVAAQATDQNKVKSELEAAQADLEKAKTFISDLVKKVLVASGEADPKVSAVLSEMIASYETKVAALAANIPVGGVANGSVKDLKATQVSNLGAFKVRQQ